MADTIFGNNPFSNSGYDAITMTTAINFMPNMYGRVGELGVFPEEGVSTVGVFLERMNNILNLLPTRPRGSEPTLGTTGKREGRAVQIPHIPHDLVVLPEEVQGVRKFGSAYDLDTIADLMARKLKTAANKHAITLEWMRINALQGIVLDYDASTVILNLFTEFGITQHTQNFTFSSSTEDVSSDILAVVTYMEQNLHGEVMDRVYCLCSQGFYQKLTSHPNVKAAFQYFQTNQPLSGDYRRGFSFAGVTFEQYVGTASDAAGNAHLFIPANQAVFFPLGTQETFRTYFAPADFNETVNTLGLPMYARQEPRKFNRGTDIHTQSNPLPICRRPELLVAATTS